MVFYMITLGWEPNLRLELSTFSYVELQDVEGDFPPTLP